MNGQGLTKRPTVLLLLAATGFYAMSPAAFAAGPAPLKGTMYLSGRTTVDPPPNEPKNTHAGFTIEGAAAMRMFRAMKSKAEADACMDKGWVSKFAGPMFCSLAPGGKKATCYMTVSLADGKLSSSRQGC
ncbi:MAG: hypothetical protein KDJ29_16005 [Hyphomicrobiales bacterium]|nr:hypothetical protein [Hyphomicrobiales bacterium]